jgi:uncharacterized protein YpmS
VVQADSTYVSGQTSSYYNSGGYSGSLSSYIDSYTKSPSQSQTISGHVGQSASGICDTRYGPDWMHCNPKEANPSKVYYSSDGYSGNLSFSNYQYWQSPNYSSGNGHLRFDWSRTWYYGGTVTKPGVDTPNFLYAGTVYRQYSDNRQYTQNYSGTVYSGGNTPTYAYTVTLQYVTDFTAPTGNLAQTPTGATNGNVTLNLTSITDTGGAGYYRTKLPNGTFVATTSASQVVTANGTYSFVIYDNAGNSTTKTITVSNIDKSAPTGTLVQTPTGATNDDVTLNLTAVADTGGSGLNNIKLPNGTLVTGTSASQVVTANGTYSFVIYDNAGNSTTKTIVVSNIDKTAPTGTLTQTPIAPTNGNVTLNLTSIADTGGSGFYGIRLPNGQLVTTPGASQTVTVNGSYSFTIYDNAGNSTIKTIWVTNIDRIPPTATLTQTPTDWTNGNVTLNLANITDSGFGVKNIQLPDGSLVNAQNLSYLVTTNGTYNFVITDNAGNSTTKSITVSNIDKTVPTGTLAQTPTSATNGDVTLNLTAIADTGGSGYYRTKLPNGTFVTTTSASEIVTANGAYSFVIYDNAGNSTTKTITVTNIDKTAPTGNLAQTPTTATNGNVTLNLTSIADTGGAGYYRTQLPNGTFVTTTSASEVVTANGTYSFVIYDNVGNSTTKSITVSNIDKTAPTGNLAQTPTAWTNGDVTLNLTSVNDAGGSILKNIQLPNGTLVTGLSASQVVTTNGTYSFVIYDNAGNSTTKTIVVSNIDKTVPVGSVVSTNPNPTNQPVTLRASGSDTGSGLELIELLTGNYTGRNLLDNSNREATGVNEFLQFGDISPIIDKNGLVPITISFDIKVAVPGNVNVYSQNGSTAKYSIGYTPIQATTSYVRHSVTVTPSLQDATVAKTMLAFYGTYGSGRIATVRNVKVELGSTESAYTQAPEDMALVSGSKDFEFSSNGTYEFLFEDKAGNQTLKSFTINNIDTLAPTGTLSQTPTVATNGNVTLNLTSIADTGGSGYYRTLLPNGTYVTTTSASQVVTASGTYTFVIYDRAGNSTTKTITVTNIDKTAPTGNLAQTPTAWTNGNVTLNLTAIADTGGSGVKNIQLPNGTLVTGTSASYLVTANGTYTFVIYDNAGNSKTESITVSNIDKTAPTGNLTQTPITWTSGNVTLNLTSVNDAGGSILKNIQLPNGTLVTGLSASQVVTTNGTYSFVIYDNAGNSTTKTITVGNIDKVNPTGTVTFVPGDTALTIRYEGLDNLSGVKSIVLPNSTIVTGSTASYSVTTPGTYTAIVEDNVGNKTNIVATVQAPNVTITQEVTDWTNREAYALTVKTSPRYVTKAKIQASFEGTSWLNENQRIAQISENGTYEFKVNDGGIVATGTISVTNFDRQKSIISIQEKATSASQATYNVRVTEVGDVKP